MIHTIRDLTDARRLVLQSLWWQRVVPPNVATVRNALGWARTLLSSGEPIPPPGVVADLGYLALGSESDRGQRQVSADASHLPINLLRAYEDHVLGRLDADWSFSRAADALRRYQGRDRDRALAYFFTQFRQHCPFASVDFSPAVLTTLFGTPPEDVLSQGWATLQRDGPHPLLVELYTSLVRAARGCAEFLSSEDLFELEHGTALADLGERVARRQVLEAVSLLEAALPRHAVRRPSRSTEVPTRLLAEDTYPVGGFSSLSTRGSVESLLQSQLAFMETDERPDLFDIKFLRDELLYYARDENQFLRRRRTFVFVLHPDLVATRFKDPELPYQRGVLLLALLVLLVRRLTDLLSADALQFKVIFINGADPLVPERELLRTLLPEGIANGTVELLRAVEQAVGRHCTDWARYSLCHALSIAAVQHGMPKAKGAVITPLRIDGPRPALGEGKSEPAPEGETPLEGWGLVLKEILQLWM